MTDKPSLCPVARRAVLVGTGGAGLAALLAACGDDQPTGGPDAAGSPEPAESTAEPSEVEPTEENTEPEPPADALVSVDEVPVGGGVLTLGDVLVVQPKKGTFRAFDAHCPHEATIVEPPDSAGVITCTGHYSHFRAEDGSRMDGPAPRGLRQVQVRVTDGYVVRT